MQIHFPDQIILNLVEEALLKLVELQQVISFYEIVLIKKKTQVKAFQIQVESKI